MTDAAKQWVFGKFKIADADAGVTEMNGLTCGELGLYQRSDCWSITHLNTGHAIFFLEAPLATVIECADEIAALGDWSFAGLFGWRDMNPELGRRVGKIKDKYGGHSIGATRIPEGESYAAQIHAERKAA